MLAHRIQCLLTSQSHQLATLAMKLVSNCLAMKLVLNRFVTMGLWMLTLTTNSPKPFVIVTYLLVNRLCVIRK
ncbi:hypothetical protein DPMN_067992 [Dreissena polymorpha]|uniref:Uncharacterized protein n=1 Tax=Dreissena polymorpha TaxID=45954 RepID=A0A9D3Z1P2_DREPO|nr:hypothetical protein DPMN_067992 [Dreissena polymorpha]